MIEADSIPQHLLPSARTEISRHVRKLGGEPQEGSFSLGESFSVWTLRAGFEHDSEPESAFHPIGYWQQIFVAERAAAFARLAVSGNELVLEAIGAISAAPAIDGAIEWIDANVSGDYVVRLLIVPFAHAHLFWLHGEDDRVVPIDRAVGPLQPLQIYPAGELLAAATKLRRQLDHSKPG
jgi:hypothetical protein